MAIRADRRYTGRVVEGSLYQSNNKKTPGFQLLIDCEDGTAEYTIWLTEKNKDRARRDFDTLGVTAQMLTSRNGWTFEIPGAVAGREVQFGTVIEEYGGEPRVKVSWIGKPGAANAEELAASVASLFGGGSSEAAAVGYSRDSREPQDLNAALGGDDF